MGIKQSTSYISYDATRKLGSVITPDTQRVELKEWREGNESPRWKTIINEGGNATTVLDAYRETASNSAGFWTGTQDGTTICESKKQGILGYKPVAQTVPDSLVAKAKADATAKAYKIINKMLSTFSGQIFAGELKETKNLLLNPFKQSVELARALVRARNVGKEAAESWLQFQFGIKPLLSDIDAICTLLNEEVERVHRLGFRTYGAADSSTSSLSSSMQDIYGFYQDVETRESLKAEHIIRFAISRAFLDSANKHRTDWRASFNSLADVPMTAWELTPWSFLADYFVNISDIIQAAVTVTSGLTYMSNSTIRTYEYTQTGSTMKVRSARWIVTANVPRVFTYQKRSVHRDGAPLGIPPLVFSLPGDNIKYLNIAALIASFKR